MNNEKALCVCVSIYVSESFHRTADVWNVPQEGTLTGGTEGMVFQAEGDT